MSTLNRLCSHWNDKKLAEKCGLQVKNICVHESDGIRYANQFAERWQKDKAIMKCIKCGEFYK